MDAPWISRPALAGFSLYFFAAMVVGEVWPLSRFPMYAHIQRDGAMPVMLAEGELTPPEALTGFFGCGAADVRIPSGVPTRMGWRQDEIQRWVAANEGAAPGEVAVVFGWVAIEVGAWGVRLGDEVHPLCTGTARRPR